jgi:hypothetical protein
LTLEEVLERRDNTIMNRTGIICPICEKINTHKGVICRYCGQDLRLSPLNDYVDFVESAPGKKKRDICSKLGLLKHKVKISLDTIKYLMVKSNYDKVASVLIHYRRQIEQDRSSASYYLLLYSREIFFRFYGLMLIDCHVYFILLKTYLVKAGIPATPSINMLFEEGLKILDEHNRKLISLIDEIILEVEKVSEKEIEAFKWESPPPPPFPGLPIHNEKR